MRFPFSLFNKESPQQSQEKDELNKLLLFTKSIIPREDVLEEITSKYARDLQSSGEIQITGYIQTYLGLENYILSNKPPAVKRAFTKDELRETIRNTIKIKLLPESVQLMFLPIKLQLIALYERTAQAMADYIANQAGPNKLLQIIANFNSSHQHAIIEIQGEKLDFAALRTRLTEVAPVDIISYFNKLDTLLYETIVSSFGINAAQDIFQKDYTPIKERYDYDLITNYLKAIPEGVLDRERVAYMTREDLEKQATLAAEERIRSETYQKSAEELQQTINELKTSKDTVVNLLNESQKLEKDLRTERDRVNAIISSMNEGLFVVNTEYKITLINHSAIKLLNLPEEGFLGRDLYNLFTITKEGKLLDKPETPLAQTLATGKTVIADVRENLYYSNPSGLKFPIMVSSSPLFDVSGRIVGGVLVFRDITETLKYEQTLRDEKAIIEQKVQEQTKVISEEKQELEKAIEKVNYNYLQAQKSEAKLMASIKNLTIGFIATHTDDKISSINTAAKTILGITNDPVELAEIDVKLGNVINLKEQLAQIRQNKTANDIKELQVEERFYHIVITPVLLTDQNQEYIGSVIIIEDITETKKLEKTKDEFFAIASHDLRTPLTAIRGYISLIETMYSSKITDPEVTQMIKNIDISALRLIDLVNEYLNVTRLDRGKLTYVNESFAVLPLIEETVKEIETLVTKKNLTIQIEKTTQPEQVIFADREKTKQVVMNLLGNAIKFTDHGGITVSLSLNQDMVDIRVTDTGRGIAKEFQNRMFKQFQLEGTDAYKRDNTQGSGLGLYISKRLIENMNGVIKLEKTEENKGATFLVSLPIHQLQTSTQLTN